MTKTVLERLSALGKTRYSRYAVSLIAVLVLLLPHKLRDANALLTGREAYYLLNKGVLSFILNLTSEKILMAKLIPLVFGILSLLLFYSILLKLGTDSKTILVSCLILIISPNFLYLFATLNGYFIPVLIILIISYLILSKKEWLSLPLFFLLPFFGYVHSLVALACLTILMIKIKNLKLLIAAASSLIILFFYRLEPLLEHGSYISDFGGKFGIGLFIVILSLFGLRMLWKEKYKHICIYLICIALILIARIDLRVLSYLNFVAVVLAAKGLMSIKKIRWESNLIKNLTCIIFICSLVFSGFSYATLLSTDLPNREIMEALNYLKDISNENDTVLTHNTREYWIAYIGRKTISNEELFYSRDIVYEVQQLKKYDIKYIWIDKDMKNKVWKEDEEGLLFLMKYSTAFKKIFINNFVTIWKVENA